MSRFAVLRDRAAEDVRCSVADAWPLDHPNGVQPTGEVPARRLDVVWRAMLRAARAVALRRGSSDNRPGFDDGDDAARWLDFARGGS